MFIVSSVVMAKCYLGLRLRHCENVKRAGTSFFSFSKNNKMKRYRLIIITALWHRNRRRTRTCVCWTVCAYIPRFETHSTRFLCRFHENIFPFLLISFLRLVNCKSSASRMPEEKTRAPISLIIIPPFFLFIYLLFRKWPNAINKLN